MSFWNSLKTLFGAKPYPANTEPNLDSDLIRGPETDNSTGPEAVLICTDAYHLDHFGKNEAGFILWMGSQLKYNHEAKDTTDYIFKFEFEANGDLVSHDIQTVGLRNAIKPGLFQEKIANLLELNPIIAPVSAMIKPFTVIHEGVEFGLIVREPEDAEDLLAVEFMPGNTMAFFEPFDSGEYDT